MCLFSAIHQVVFPLFVGVYVVFVYCRVCARVCVFLWPQYTWPLFNSHRCWI